MFECKYAAKSTKEGKKKDVLVVLNDLITSSTTMSFNCCRASKRHVIH